MTRLLADLVARRRQIFEMIAAEAQRTRRMSDKRLTKCVARLRKVLEKEHSDLDALIGAMVAARYNPHLKSFRDKLVAAGKSKLVAALIAVARKLTTIVNAILRDRRPWQPIPA